MARINNLTNFLTDVAAAIKEKTGDSTAIPAEEFDTKIAEIQTQGSYQTKSTTISTNGNYSLTPDTGYDAMNQVDISVNVPQTTANLQTKTITTNGEHQPDTGYDGFSSVNVAVPSQEVNNQDTTITQNGVYIPDTGYTGFGEVTVNVSSGSGGVKLFETEQAMQNDPDPSEGDLAIIYRSEIQPVTGESEFDSCIFPNEVVLSEAFTGSIYGMFSATDQSVMFDGMVEVSSSRFRFRGHRESSEISVRYTSQDGITYTRTDGGEELQEFGTNIKWESGYGDFNEVLGNFMKIGRNCFEGLFQYHNGLANTSQRLLPLMSNITVDFTNHVIACDFTNNPYSIDNDKIFTLANKIAEDDSLSPSTSLIFLDTSDQLHLIPSVGNRIPVLMYSSNESEQYPAFYVNKDTTTGVVYTDYILDLENQTYTSSSLTFTTAAYGVNYYRYYSGILLKTCPVELYIRSTDGGSFWYNQTYNKISPFKLSDTTTVGANVADITSSDIWLKENKYIPTSTQLNATSDYVYNQTFYGKNGVEEGTLNIITNLTKDQLIKRVEVYNQLSSTITIAETDLSYCFANGDITTIPMIDTSGVTNMYEMFNSCGNLTTIPVLDTSNVTNMSGMFHFCTNLTTVPTLNTSNVTKMENMFNLCESLTTVPIFDTSEVVWIGDMFRDCPSLSNESLNNILAMCADATAFTGTKTLKYIGLSSTQATTCTGLSNWSAAQTAGWTTGY